MHRKIAAVAVLLAAGIGAYELLRRKATVTMGPLIPGAVQPTVTATALAGEPSGPTSENVGATTTDGGAPNIDTIPELGGPMGVGFV